jgi:hypothetical protein
MLTVRVHLESQSAVAIELSDENQKKVPCGKPSGGTQPGAVACRHPVLPGTTLNLKMLGRCSKYEWTFEPPEGAGGTACMGGGKGASPDCRFTMIDKELVVIAGCS